MIFFFFFFLIMKLLLCFVLFLICSERDKTRVKEERVDPKLNPLFYFSLLLSLFFFFIDKSSKVL